MNVYVIKQKKFTLISQAGRGTFPLWTVSFWPHTAWTLPCVSPLPTQHSVIRNDAQSHHILSLSSHSKNLPSQLHSAANSMVTLATLCSQYGQLVHLKSVLVGRESACSSKRGREEVCLSVHITGSTHLHQHFCSGVAICVQCQPTLSFWPLFFKSKSK